MAEGFKIAEGFVLVNVTLDERQADEMGARAAERVAKQIEDSPALKKAAEDAGKKTGDKLGEEAAKSADEKLAEAKDKFVATTEDIGSDAGRKGGEQLGEQLTTVASGRLRDGKGRFIAASEDMGAEAGKKTGEILGGEAATSAEGRLRDAKGRFIKAGEDIGKESGTSFGKGFLGEGERLGKDVEQEGMKLGEHVSAGFLSRLYTRLMGDGQSSGLIGTITNVLGKGSSKMVEGLSNIPWVGVIFKPISDAMGSMPPQAQLAIGGAIATAITASAAMIGAALNGVLLAAIGLGGITLGIIGQISNPVVREAFSFLGKDFVLSFQQATSGFEKPLVFAAQIFGGALQSIMPGLKDDFDKLGMFVAPLAEGMSRLMINIMPGLSKAFDAAGPILMELARQLPGLGSAISDMFSAMAGGQKGAIEGLRTLMLIIDTTIRMVGYLLEGLSQIYTVVVSVGNAWSGWLAKIPILGEGAKMIHNIFDAIANGSYHADGGIRIVARSLAQVGLGAKLASDDFSALVKQINSTAETSDIAAGAMSDKLFNALMSTDQATLGVYEAQTKLGTELQKNGLAIDKHTGQIAMNTAKGQQNREAILSAVSANIKMYDTQIASGVSAQDAAAAYDQNTAALRKQLRQAGLTEGQVDSLIGKYGQVPDTVNTNIIMKGLADAINNLDETLRLINGLDGRNVVTTVTTRFVSDTTHAIAAPGQHVAQRYGGVVHAAAGLVSGVMPEQDPPAVMFAERGTGGEIFAPLRGISQQRAMGLGQLLGDAYDFDVRPRTTAPGPIVPTSAHSPQGGAPINVTVLLDGREIGAQITLDPVRVSAAASEGDRLRGGNLPGFRPAGR